MRAVLFSALIVFCSGCWHSALLLQNYFHEVADLHVSPESFPEGCTAVNYAAGVEIRFPHFPSRPSPEIVSGRVPPGLTLEVLPGEGGRFMLCLRGVPQAQGEFEFTARLQCCGTMAGPAFRAERRFRIEVGMAGRCMRSRAGATAFKVQAKQALLSSPD
jgi:hypothetical protein